MRTFKKLATKQTKPETELRRTLVKVYINTESELLFYGLVK